MKIQKKIFKYLYIHCLVPLEQALLSLGPGDAVLNVQDYLFIF